MERFIRKTRFMVVLVMVFLLTNMIIVPPALSMTSAGTVSPAAGVTESFPDVQQSDSNLVYIKYMVSRGLVQGFPDGKFHPAAGLTRAEASVLLTQAGALKAESSAAGFKDVSPKFWAASSIAAAKAAGLLRGYPDGTFRPNGILTRAEGVALLLKLSKQADPGVELPDLADIRPGHWAARPAAIGIAAGMVGLTSDNKHFLPDAAFTRESMARALAVLLTSDPDLYQTDLSNRLKTVNGTAALIHKGSKDSVAAPDNTMVQPGDTIVTGPADTAQLVFPDGTGLLIKENSKLTLKESKGRAYIKEDGSTGTAVEWLNVSLDQGKMFGALATSQEQPETSGVSSTTVVQKAGFGVNLRARLTNDPEKKAGKTAVMAALPQNDTVSWWKTAKTKRTKVKVDMPTGVAAIRGTFWQNMVTADGGFKTNVLTGNAEVTAAGQTVSLTAGLRTEVDSAGRAPDAPVSLTRQDNLDWAQQSTWAQERASQIVQNQEAIYSPPPSADLAPAATVPQQQPQPPQNAVKDITGIINKALDDAQHGSSIVSSEPDTTGSAPAAKSETMTVNNPDVTGFTVNLNPALVGLTGSNFILRDGQNNPVNITSATTSDSGATYTIGAALTAGQTYTLTASKTGYNFGTALNVAVPAPAVTGLVAWWKGEGNGNDSAGNYNGTLVGGAGYAPGKSGQAFSFNGAGQYLSLPNSLIDSQTTWTVAAWFKTTSGGVIFGTQDGPYNSAQAYWGPFLFAGTDGKLSGGFWGNQVEGGTTVTDGNWHHAAVSFGSSTTLYLDGVKVGSVPGYSHQPMMFNQIGSGYTVYWPSNTANGWFDFNGQIDECALFNQTLTPSVIQTIYNSGINSNMIYTVPIRDFTSTGKTDATASFSFSAPTGAGTVKIQQSADGGSTWTNAATTGTLTAASTTATVTGLTLGTNYKFKLVITGGVHTGDSNVVDVTTDAVPWPIRFQAKTDYVAGSAPRSVAAGDFNGDGKQDLATANYNANTVSILLGNGDGTYQAKTDYVVGTSPEGEVAGDFNGDGKLDLATANFGSNTVSILLGNGDGTFQTKVDYGVGSYPFNVAISDFNGDNRPDLVVSNSGVTQVSVLLGNGNGTFQTKVDYWTGGCPFWVAAGDLNGDGKSDLAVANSNNTVSILLGNGDGTFQTKTDYAVGVGPNGITVGDFNGDGAPDLATANATGNSVSVLLNNRSGTFQAKVDYTVGTTPRNVTFGDFNGDGHLDLAVASANSSTVSILPGNGDGTFGTRSDLAAGNGAWGLAAADFDGDGWPDLAAANYWGNSVSVFMNNTPAPIPVSDFTSIGITNVTASFGFSAPTGASTVKIQQSADRGSTWTDAVTGTLTAASTSATVTGLTANSNYSFKLVVTGGVHTGYSNVVTLTTSV